MRTPTKKDPPPLDHNRALPFSEEAEKGVLSCILQQPDLITYARSKIPVESFYHSATQQLYKVLLEFARLEIPIDLVTLANYLIDNDLMNKIGGPSILPELLSFVPTPSHFDFYMGIIESKRVAREIIGLCSSAAQKSYGWISNPMELYSGFKEAVDSIGKSFSKETNFSEQVDEYMQELRDKVSGEKSSFTESRWRCWNEKIGGVPQGYILVMGERKRGKSSLMLNVASDFALPPDDGVEPKRTLIYSYEMPYSQLIGRMISDRFNINSIYTLTPDLYHPNEKIMERIEEAAEYIRKAPMKIITDPRETSVSIRAKAEAWGAHFVGVDYLQLMPMHPSIDPKEKKNVHVEENSKELCRASLAINGTVMVLSQRNADGEAAWSRGTENDATLTLAIEDDGLHVKSRRSGKAGGVIPLELDGAFYRFNTIPNEKKTNGAARGAKD